ncbi:MAG: right-handed parallel beta-helix repeat-containing protein [Bacteroidota bacterium]
MYKFCFFFLCTLCLGQTLSAQRGLQNLRQSVLQNRPVIQQSVNQAQQMLATASEETAAQNASLPTTQGKDYYVSASQGRGRLGTKAQPAKDLAAIISLLEAGDRVHIAAGVYRSKASRGSDIIEVPVSIIGGYDESFSHRDPWGSLQTVFSGTNDYQKTQTTERLAILTDKQFRQYEGRILIDGIIIDNSERNRYKTDAQQQLMHKASPAAGQGPSPTLPGIRVRTGHETKVEIRNCVLINCAATQGVLDVQIGRNGKAQIVNNLLVNNSGESIYCKSKYHSNTGYPEFYVAHNTILFSWAFDPVASYGGSNIMMDNACKVVAEYNVLGFGDFGGVNNVKKALELQLNHNVFFGHTRFDYREFNTDLPLEELEDYAEYLNPKSQGNRQAKIQLPLDQSWAKLYFGRNKMTREQLDASVSVASTDANALRSMLGLNLQGSSNLPTVEIWLPRLALADALKLGLESYDGAGCQKP